MPLLDDQALKDLREQQKTIYHCAECSAQLWQNYCRECDEMFRDGHYPTCKNYDKHSEHRKY